MTLNLSPSYLPWSPNYRANFETSIHYVYRVRINHVIHKGTCVLFKKLTTKIQ